MGWRIGLSVVWLLLVCYPDPRVLWRSIGHALRPPIDVTAVREWAEGLPDDPRLIERAVHERLRYGVPWQTDGVPWAFPSPAAALAAGYADCQGRAVVLASVLAAKGIPYQLRASLDHMWVEYPGKLANAKEQAAKVLWARDTPAPAAMPRPLSAERAPEEGAARFRLRWPQVDWWESLRAERAYFWDAAPWPRKLALLAGFALVWCPWKRWRGAADLPPLQGPTLGAPRLHPPP